MSKAIVEAFTAHPRDVGESYGEHMAVAASFGGRMILGGMACLVHAVFPFLCVKTGSQAIGELHERMVLHRRRQPAVMPGMRPAE